MREHRDRSAHGNHVGTVVGYKPFRDRPVMTIKVQCPVCKVEAGTRCKKVDGSGDMAKTTHAPRRAKALREGF